MRNAAIYAIAVLAAMGIVVLVVVFRKSQFDDQGAYVATIRDSVDSTLAQLAEAIAHAEGYGVKGAIPTLAHNPGDLVIPGWTGGKLGSEGISVFNPDNADTEGWNRLYHQLEIIRSGVSHVYSMSDTILSMARKWTATDSDAWASNVAAYLTVSVDTPLSDPKVLGVS